MKLDDLKREVGQLIQDRAMDFSYPVKLEVDQGAYIARHVLDYLHAQGRIVPDGYTVIPKLINGWEIFCIGRYSDGELGYWLETKHTESGKLCRDMGIPIVYGLTLESVFMQANRKIAAAQKGDE